MGITVTRLYEVKGIISGRYDHFIPIGKGIIQCPPKIEILGPVSCRCAHDDSLFLTKICCFLIFQSMPRLLAATLPQLLYLILP
jgi:hypothetical protein